MSLAESNNAGHISSISDAYRDVSDEHGMLVTVKIRGGTVPAGMTVLVCV
jgi:hypothetical protein